MIEAELKFVSPPVRAVELTLFFDPVPLKLTDLAPLVTLLRAEFPETTEQFALMPWQYEESTPESLPAFIEGGAFPFPWMTFSNNSGRSISFQDDRLTLRWEFSEEREYPGYVDLVSQLKQQFSAFREHAEQHPGATVQVVRARAEYDNAMPPYSAWTVSKQSHQLTSAVDASLLPNLRSTNAGGVFQFKAKPYATKVEYSAVSKEDAETLSLRATTRAAEGGPVVGFDALEVAHSRLLECFAMLTTQEQHELWGKK